MAHAKQTTDELAAERDLIRRAVDKDPGAIRAILKTYNRRLFRIARSIMRTDQEAEDALQDAYLQAFSRLATFRQDSSLATWLTRIVINEALQRSRKRTEVPISQFGPDGLRSADVIPFPLSAPQAVDPERAMAQNEICKLIERAIDALPDEYRTVLIARTLEDMSIEETAELLGLRPETVKTRLHRARAALRAALAGHLEPMFADVFPFDGARCERMTNEIVQRICDPEN